MHPVTISTEAAYALIVPFVMASNVVNRVGKISAAPIEELVGADAPGAAVVSAMSIIRTHMAPLIGTDLMSREYDSISNFRDKLEALVSSKAFVSKGGSSVASLFVDFLKCIAWMAGNAVWRAKKFTLNYEQTLLILANFGLCAPGEKCMEELVSEVEEQVNTVILAQERAAEDAKEKKAAADKKALAEKKAKLALAKAAVSRLTLPHQQRRQRPKRRALPQPKAHRPQPLRRRLLRLQSRLLW